MNDDVRHPRQNSKNEDQNKDQLNAGKIDQAQELESPHVYSSESGFVAASASQKLKKRRFPKLSLKQASKKHKIIGGMVIVVLLIGGGGGVLAYSKSANKTEPNVAPPIVEKQVEAPQPTTEASRLTGEQINPELNKRQLTSVMIENSPDARPQSGLKDAGVVYEAVAEGGITRFLALFQETQPDYIGPVRSVRPYYVDFLLPYDASIVHAGGSSDGLNKVRNSGAKDIDHGANGSAFRRVNDRFAPHNLYTSMADLDKVSAARGYTKSDVKSLPRKEEKTGQQVTARTVNLNISSALYNVRYDYDQASNSYKRVLAGKPHTDLKSGQQLSPKVVVAIVSKYSQNGIYSVYQTTGSGKVYIFQDGVAQEGTWTKASESEQYSFTDAAGNPIAINPGQTWISLVKSSVGNAVTYTP